MRARPQARRAGSTIVAVPTGGEEPRRFDLSAYGVAVEVFCP